MIAGIGFNFNMITELITESTDSRIAIAVSLARVAHCGQTRKNSGEAYINHPFRVATRVKALGGSIETQCAAILHDAVEDSKGMVTLAMIEHALGVEVCFLVERVTHRHGEDYFDYIHRAIAFPDPRLIKRCDVQDNMSDLSTQHRNWLKYTKVLKMIGDIERQELEFNGQ
jgi:hypothetical protein